MTNTVNAVFKGGYHFAVDVNGHTVDIDAGRENGGQDAGPSPKIFMLLSLAGCTGFDIVSILNKMRVEFSDFNVRIEGDLTDEIPAVYDKMRIKYTIKVREDDRTKMEKAVRLSEEKYCGVSKMYQTFAKIDFQIEYL